MKLEPIEKPPHPWDSMRQSIVEFKAKDYSDLDFAIEAIRLNLVCATYKDELILLEAMQRLEKLRDETNG